MLVNKINLVKCTAIKIFIKIEKFKVDATRLRVAHLNQQKLGRGIQNPNLKFQSEIEAEDHKRRAYQNGKTC